MFTRALVITGLIATFCLCFSLAGQPQENSGCANNPADRTKDLHARMAYDRGVELYQKFFRGCGPSFDGNCGKEDFTEAMVQARESLRIDPDYAAAHTLLGNLLESKRDYDAAIAEYRIAIRLWPDYSAAHHDLGIALENKEEIDLAIDQHREAVRSCPMIAEAQYGLALVLAKKKLWEQSISYLLESIRLAPNKAEYWGSLGHVLLVAGKNSQEGEDALVQATRLDPGNALHHWKLAVALEVSGQLKKAVAECKDALRLGIGSTSAAAFCHFEIAKDLEYTGDLVGATTEYRLAVSQDSNNAKAHYRLGRLLRDGGELNEGLRELQAAAVLEPDNAMFSKAAADLERNIKR